MLWAPRMRAAFFLSTMSVLTSRQPFVLGVCCGVVVVLGSLAFSQARIAVLRVLREGSVRKWNARVGHSSSVSDHTPVEVRRSGSVVDGISGAIGACTAADRKYATCPHCKSL